MGHGVNNHLKKQAAALGINVFQDSDPSLLILGWLYDLGQIVEHL